VSNPLTSPSDRSSPAIALRLDGYPCISSEKLQIPFPRYHLSPSLGDYGSRPTRAASCNYDMVMVLLSEEYFKLEESCFCFCLKDRIVVGQLVAQSVLILGESWDDHLPRRWDN
jgi:hypothetical protein